MKLFFPRRLFVAACVAWVACGLHAQNLTRYTAQPGSKVKLDGTSNIHDWTVEGGIVGGAMELDSAFMADPPSGKPGKIAAKVEVTIPVRSLKSGNKLMDDRMYDAFKQPQFPQIKYRLTELTLKEAPKSANGPFTFDSKGELAVSGVTNKVSFPVTIARTDKTMKATGSTTVKMTSFGITPPGLVVAIRTGDDVKITFDWLTSPAEAAKKE